MFITSKSTIMERPQTYCKNPGKVKAFVLGCDPTDEIWIFWEKEKYK